MTDSSTPLPHRRFVLNLRLGADTRDALAHALEQLAFEIVAGQVNGPGGACGGPDAGYSYEFLEDQSVTHDSYFAAIDAMREARKAAGGAS